MRHCHLPTMSRAGFHEAKRRIAAPSFCKASVHLRAAFISGVADPLPESCRACHATGTAVVPAASRALVPKIALWQNQDACHY